jgi:hypothetical protein
MIAGRRTIAVGCGLLVAVLAWPAVHPTELDSLPVSNYPMFAHPRAQVSRFDVAVFIGADGERERLDLRRIGGTDQPVQAAMTLRQAIREGAAGALCDELADGLDRPGTVEVASERYDTVGWFRGEKEPVAREVHATCTAEASS